MLSKMRSIMGRRLVALCLLAVLLFVGSGFRACGNQEIRENVNTAVAAIHNATIAILASLPPDSPKRQRIEQLQKFVETFQEGFNSFAPTESLLTLLADVVTGLRFALDVYLPVGGTIAFLLIAADVALRTLVSNFRAKYEKQFKEVVNTKARSVGDLLQAVTAVEVLREYLESEPAKAR